jgi:hypothetical protein
MNKRPAGEYRRLCLLSIHKGEQGMGTIDIGSQQPQKGGEMASNPRSPPCEDS